MKKLILATSNKHKLAEFKQMLSGYEILSLADIGFNADIDESGDTTDENATIKATTIRKFCEKMGIDIPVIADDSGLFIDALAGAPGVHSARYSGDHDDEANRQKVLKNLEGKTNRDAHFECAICYADGSGTKVVKGQTFGKITTKKISDESFGYDCIFYSTDLNKTFGEASEEEKDSVSHRGRAVEGLKKILK